MIYFFPPQLLILIEFCLQFTLPVPNSEPLDVKLCYFVIFSSTSLLSSLGCQQDPRAELPRDFFFSLGCFTPALGVQWTWLLFWLISLSQQRAPGGANATQLQFAEIAALLLLMLPSLRVK